MPVAARTEWSGENLIVFLSKVDGQVDKQTIKATCLPLINISSQPVCNFLVIAYFI